MIYCGLDIVASIRELHVSLDRRSQVMNKEIEREYIVVKLLVDSLQELLLLFFLLCYWVGQ